MLRSKRCWSAQRLLQAVEHLLLARADPLGVEADEAAFLRRVRRLLSRGDQPLAHGSGLLRRRLLVEDPV
jgi:hypothetical protein